MVLSSKHFYLSRLDNRLWLFGFYFCLSPLEWIVSRLAVLVACQHKPANLVQNLIISLLFSTHLNSSTVQVCQKCCSSIEDWSFLPGEYLYLHSALFFFGVRMCTYKGGVGGRNSSPKRQTSISLPKLETYLNLLDGNQPFSWFPTHAQGRVSSSAEFLKSPYSLLHRVWYFQCRIQLSAVCARLPWFTLEKSIVVVCVTWVFFLPEENVNQRV